MSTPGTGGLPERRLDQTYTQPPTTVAPGSASGIFRGRLVIISGSSANGSNGLFVYSGAPAAGNLILSISAVAGTDQYGNNYRGGGLAIYKGGQTFFIGIPGLLPEIDFFTGVAMELKNANISAGTTGAALLQLIQLVISGPRGNAAGGTDWAQIVFTSNNAGGTAPASGFLVYINDAQVALSQLRWGANGVSIQNGLSLATVSTTANELNLTNAAGLAGNVVVGQSDISTVTVTATGQTQLCAGYSVPANDAVIGATYRLKTFGTGTQGATLQTLTFAAAFGLLGNTGSGITFGTADFTASGAFRWSCQVTIMCVTTGTGGTWLVNCEATVTSSAGNFSGSSTNTTPLAFSTTIGEVLSASCSWGATTTNPSISSFGSFMERIV